MVDYTNALEKLNKAENTYGKEIGYLNNTINELRNKIQNLENAEKKSSEIVNELNDELENKNILENDKKALLKKLMILLILIISYKTLLGNMIMMFIKLNTKYTMS